MMKRLFCLMALLLVPALARADMVSIAELREQAEEMGRWTQTYEAHGRTIEVDVPIIVPEVEKMPVATIEWLKMYEDEQFEAFNREQGAEVTRTDTELVIDYHIEPDERNDVEKWRNDTFRITCSALRESYYYIEGRYNETSDLYTLHPNKHLVSPYTYYYPWEIDANGAYAEDNPLTIQEIDGFLKMLLEKIGVNQWEFQMKEVCVAGRGRTVKNLNEAALGETVDYVPMGYYDIYYAQKFYGIPVIIHSFNMYSHQSFIDLGKRPNTGNRGGYIPQCGFEYRMMDGSSFYFDALGIGKPKEVTEEDVPLAPLSKVISSIEEKIESGNIRDVYNLQLGYALMLSPYESDSQQFYVYPFWKLECSWLDSAKKEKQSHPDPGYAEADFRQKMEYREIGINAQTGELVYPTFTKRSEITDDLYDCPKIITWEEAD
ncbi:MAG: hypothetical protein Q4F18_09690 [Clostridia bacterium]|nr:hypothetical protein [Clostridia bacterium]